MIYYSMVFFIAALASGSYGFVERGSEYAELATSISILFLIIAFASFIMHTTESNRQS